MKNNTMSLAGRISMAFAVAGLMAVSVPTGARAGDETASGDSTQQKALAAQKENLTQQESRRVQARAAKHQAMMNAGKTTHAEAWSATDDKTSPGEAKRMRAAGKRHQELMKQGKTHEQAWQVTDSEQDSK